MTIYQPYTYLIGWSKLNKFYYGVRYAEGCHSADLWVKYYTSSKYVKEMRTIYGEPDIIQIRKTFNNSDDAVLWESTVLRRLNASSKDYFINQQNGSGYKGNMHDELMRSIKSKKMKEYWTEERRSEKSKKMKEYNTTYGVERYVISAKRLHSNTEFKENFTEIMSIVNKDERKRKSAGIKIKEKWKDLEYAKKMSNRKHGSNSNTMKEKWKDPEFKAMMLEKRKYKNETNKD